MATETAEFPITVRSTSSIVWFSPGFTDAGSIAIGASVPVLTMVANEGSFAFFTNVFYPSMLTN
jgi:hypothetical protein